MHCFVVTFFDFCFCKIKVADLLARNRRLTQEREIDELFAKIAPKPVTGMEEALIINVRITFCLIQLIIKVDKMIYMVNFVYLLGCFQASSQGQR